MTTSPVSQKSCELPPRLISQPPPPNADHWPQSFCIHTGSRYEAWCSPTFAAPLGRNTRGKTATNSTEFRPGRGWLHAARRLVTPYHARPTAPAKKSPGNLGGGRRGRYGRCPPALRLRPTDGAEQRCEHSAGPAPLIDAIYSPVTFDGMTAFPPPTAARIACPASDVFWRHRLELTVDAHDRALPI